MLRGAGMTSDQTEVTDVPLVLVGSVWRAHSCQSKHASPGPTSPRSSQGSGRWRGREFLVRPAAKSNEGVVADLILSAWPGFLESAGRRSFGL